jgi:methylthioribose-1-phosphate isomerase
MKRNQYYTVKWIDGKVSLIDQRFIPAKEIYRSYSDYQKVVTAIKDMEVRGAPAIGVAAAFGIALAFYRMKKPPKDIAKEFAKIANLFRQSRPTAVNLFWAVDRMTRTFSRIKNRDFPHIQKVLLDEARSIYKEDIETNKKISTFGQSLIKNNDTILTHCNAGPLATAGYGTALGVIIAAKKSGKKIKVFADETRPRLQGARLTAWELLKNGVDATLITDNMAGHFMKKGSIDIVITGADRIAANGDSANKIGTYSVAVLAKHHGIPFYIAAPLSTIDIRCLNGDAIPIEERSGLEITRIGSEIIAPAGIKTKNPAFDVTPANLIKGIITEKGIIRPPFLRSISRLFK